ncbi:MAG: rhomboid family intramembrane serine protease [Bacteroidetes bacterium GWF2_42_66]|nr:MAG: rhomboid family intramembrane serine protease [Bacteroidetes bacterium GWA2_42_15]OFY00720.1 MAG: rhomboid family intramembrane serine protease [Bacteroidetes bacterium GWE2_42_39]OFY40745.1 MAG: rhomboid family intramembrane serine protease [Bacteroidetes bacterium GWF2_42_66]HBL75754.1 rhomboid family intramembrane serine protease [Prolixibacteraceae bacterium]HCR89607.1 rhomboid family intramembrane serine protease [Prolixibacteraceae bacterium]
MQNYNSGFSSTPPVVKNLVIINALMLLATYILSMRGIDLSDTLGLHYFSSEKFRPFQLVTHMFMHGGFIHLLFNMYSLWMFGRVLESVWGPKRFFVFYFVTGLGAAALHLFVNFLEYQSLVGKMTPEMVDWVIRDGAAAFDQGKNFSDPLMAKLNAVINTPTVGASGAVYGVLLGFGMLFPNTQLMLLFPPIPIKAKYLVIGFGAIELYLGLTQSASNIAHFAHLGGMIFGFILIKYWNKSSKSFY